LDPAAQKIRAHFRKLFALVSQAGYGPDHHLPRLSAIYRRSSDKNNLLQY